MVVVVWKRWKEVVAVEQGGEADLNKGESKAKLHRKSKKKK